ncbi:MAG TPA: alkaline phosphatase family protein [Caulobacteraceae bacterium]|jgi:arylsulfatase A-like enzyme|nr:alkaline phosphatase family protein [Caulobacteraceae bacterium]
MTVEAAPLNVIFITADQWRGDCLSALGHPMVRTPNLDALAAEGVLFARHYANTAPCGPSRASLHTGLYLQNHRSHANGAPLDARHTNWALESAALGYDPVLFGYTDTSVDPRGVAADDPRLFTYEGPLPGIRTVCALDGRPKPWTDWLNAQGYDTPADIGQAYGHRADGPEYEDGAAHPRPLAWPAEVDDTAFLVGRLIDYLKTAGGPFVAHLSLLRPHPPFVAPAPYNALYDPAAVPPFARRETPEAEAAQHPWLAWRLSQRAFRATADERRLRRLKAVYYGLISRVDAEIGVLMAFLRQSGLIDRTMILFTSDHGEQMGDHWLLGKGGYFEGSYHIPLIVRDPRPRADGGRGTQVSRFTENVDIMPTLIEAIGGEIPRQCDGLSLAPFLRGAGAPTAWRTEAHWEYDFRDDAAAAGGQGLTPDQCAMNILRGERFKYVHFARLPPLLFDLAEDPDEMHDLAGDPAHAGTMLACAQALLSWRMIHDERTLTHLRLTEAGVITDASPRY